MGVRELSQAWETIPIVVPALPFRSALARPPVRSLQHPSRSLSAPSRGPCIHIYHQWPYCEALYPFGWPGSLAIRPDRSGELAGSSKFSVRFFPPFVCHLTGDDKTNIFPNFQPAGCRGSNGIAKYSLSLPPGPFAPSCACTSAPSYSRLSQYTNNPPWHPFHEFPTKRASRAFEIEQFRTRLARTRVFRAPSSSLLRFPPLVFTSFDKRHSSGPFHNFTARKPLRTSQNHSIIPPLPHSRLRPTLRSNRFKCCSKNTPNPSRTSPHIHISILGRNDRRSFRQSAGFVRRRL